jgi:hypothetical protein
MAAVEPEPCTTHSGKLKHLSRNLSANRYGPGRTGRPLCDQQTRAEVYDQAAYDGDRLKWNPKYVSQPIDGLSPCKRCDRIAKREEGR